MDFDFEHTSVLLEESIKGLNINKKGIYVDGTLGGAGHSLEICKLLDKEGLLIGIDQDANAIEKSKEVLKDYDNVKFVHDNFSNILNILENLGIDKIHGMILDLGVSSHQLDEAERGFSYMKNSKLDMRMDRRARDSAYEIVNNYGQKNLERIIFEYGEERWARRIAEFIIRERESKSIETTFELVEVIKKAIPLGARKDGPHPAKRTFQGIRIEVNQELEILKQSITDIVKALNEKGRISIISFHSLEDRIVKNTYRELNNPCTCPIDFPICICNKESELKIINRRPITSDIKELEANHRARSGKLRIGEKI